MRVTTPGLPLLTRADVHAIGVGVRKLILRRTDRGVDATGARFKPLKDGSPSRLRRTGNLLGSLRVTATETAATVVATADYARFVEEQGRPFLGLTADDETAVDALLVERVAAREAAINNRWRGRPRTRS